VRWRFSSIFSRLANDQAAVAAVDRVLLASLYAFCAFAAVRLGAGYSDRVFGVSMVPWRMWSVFLPVLVLLFPPHEFERMADRKLAAMLRAIGLLIRALTMIFSLQLIFAVGGQVPIRGFSLIFVGALFVLLATGVRPLLLRLTSSWARTVRVVIVGADSRGIKVAGYIREAMPQVEVVGFIDERQSRIDRDALPLPFLGSLSDFLTKGVSVDSVVLAMPNNATERVRWLTNMLGNGATNIYLAPEMPILDNFTVGHGKEGIETMLMLGLGKLPARSRALKRLFDIVFSSIALTFFLPLGLVLGFLVKLESSGPVMFTQYRYGLGNRLFKMYKFRSMTFDSAGQNEIRLTERGDSRVTRIGGFLRRSSLDEFPQFFNVLLGDMSVVGPRPHPPGVKAGERVYEAVVDDFMERYKVRPGITGWAQVNGLRGNTFTEGHLTERFDYDIRYIQNWSLELDIWIVIRTILGGFGGKNAF